MMELKVERTALKDKATLGMLYVNGVFECLTLEDVVRDLHADGSGKVWGDTAIPAGRYQIFVVYSPSFKKRMPLLCQVPFFTGILIHSGNTHIDTHGCILVGQRKLGDDYIQGGSVCFPVLMAKIEAALANKEEVWVTVENAFPEGVK